MIAVESSSNKVEHWQDNYQLRSRWHYVLISRAICFCIGFAAAIYCLKPSFEKQQEIINSNSINLASTVKSIRDKPVASAVNTGKKSNKKSR